MTGAPAVRRRANTELALLILAIIITLSAYALVGLSQSTPPVIPPGLLAYGGVLSALAAAAHIVIRRMAPGADPLLLPTAFLLNGIGLAMVWRIDFALASREGALELAPLQTIWTIVAIGLFCATLLLLRDHTVLDRYRYIIGLCAVMALLTPLLPYFGTDFGRGARIWVRIPGGFSLQPGEFAKIGLVIFFASYLAEKRALLSAATSRLGPLHVPPARAFGPVALAWVISLGVLVFQRDLGLSLLVFGIFVAMLYMATGRIAYVALAGVLFSGGAYTAYSQFNHVQTRVSIWLDPFADAQGIGFQLVQSLFALGTGGVAGVGWGRGSPELIPDVPTDFIFAAIGEELGLLGTTAVLLLYFLLAGRGFVIALRAPDDFSRLLAAGLTFALSLQTFVIIGGVTRLIPLTGITLPLVSYGGSSLLTNYVLIALLVRISAARRPVGRRPSTAELASIGDAASPRKVGRG